MKSNQLKLENLANCIICGSDSLDFIDKEHNICRCKNCRLVFDNPRPTQQEISNFYSLGDKYDSWLAEENDRYDLWMRRLLILKKFKSSGSLLDIGAGIGQFLYLAKNDFEIHGTEVSKSAIELAQKKFGIKLEKGELEQFEFNKQYDVITMYHVLEHLPYPGAVLNKLKKMLNKDGIIVIAVPNDISSFQTAIKRFLAVIKFGKFKHYSLLGHPKLTLDGRIPEIHLSHFSTKILTTALERSGFKVEYSGLDPYYVASGINKAVHSLIYGACFLLHKVLKINIYPTLTIVVKHTF